MTSTNTSNRPAPSTTDAASERATTGCCGGPSPADSSACCALDAEVKATGGSGCGCQATAAATRPRCCG